MQILIQLKNTVEVHVNSNSYDSLYQGEGYVHCQTRMSPFIQKSKHKQTHKITNTQKHKHMVEKQAFIMVDGGVGGPLSALSDLHTKFTSRPHTTAACVTFHQIITNSKKRSVYLSYQLSIVA